MNMSTPKDLYSTRKARRRGSHKERVTVGQYLLKQLEATGIDTLFGTNEKSVDGFFNLARSHPRISSAPLFKATTSATLAEGYARVKGISCVVVTKEGILELFQHLIRAYKESIPLIVVMIANNLKSHDTGRTLSISPSDSRVTECELTIRQLFFSYVVLNDQETAPRKIDRTVDTALHFQKPVCIELPEELIDALIPAHVSKKTNFPTSDGSSLQDAVHHIEKILDESAKPAIIASRDVYAFNVQDQLLSFAEKRSIPFATTLAGKGSLDESSELFLGTCTPFHCRGELKRYLMTADVIVFFGLSSSMFKELNLGVTETIHKIFIYESDVVVDSIRYPNVLLTDILKMLSHVREKKSYPPISAPLKSSPFRPAKGGVITPFRLVRSIVSHLPDDALISSTPNDVFCELAGYSLPHHPFVTTNTFSHNLSGLALGIGASIALLERHAVVIVTKENLLHDLSLLLAFKEQDVSLSVLVLSDAKTTQSWDFLALSELVPGVSVTQVSTEDTLDKALKKSLKNRKVFSLINILLELE